MLKINLHLALACRSDLAAWISVLQCWISFSIWHLPVGQILQPEYLCYNAEYHSPSCTCLEVRSCSLNIAATMLNITLHLALTWRSDLAAWISVLQCWISISILHLPGGKILQPEYLCYKAKYQSPSCTYLEVRPCSLDICATMLNINLHLALAWRSDLAAWISMLQCRISLSILYLPEGQILQPEYLCYNAEYHSPYCTCLEVRSCSLNICATMLNITLHFALAWRSDLAAWHLCYNAEYHSPSCTCL